MDIDKFEDHDTLYISDDSMSELSSQYDLSSYQDDDEPVIVIDDDNDSLLSEASNSESIEIKDNSNKSTLYKTHEQNMTVNDITENFTEIKIPNQQKSLEKKKFFSSIINASNNKNLYCDESILYDNKKSPPLSAVSSATVIKPTNVQKLQTFTTKINRNKSFYKPKQGLQTISSIGPKSKLHVVPLNSIHFRNSTSKVQSTANTFETLKSGQGNQPETASNFVARIEKLPGGKYKVIPTQGKVPSGLENIFKRNSHFIKHKTPTNPHTHPNTIRNQKNVGNHGVQVKTSYLGKHISSGLILSPKSQSLIQKDGQSLSVTRYGKSAKNVNIMQVSNKKNDVLLLKKSITDNNDSGSSFTTHFTDEIIKDSEFLQHSNTNEVNEEEELLNEENDQEDRFIPCNYEYCHALVLEPELIDGLYCSLVCKKLQAKQMIVIEESNIDVKKTTNTHQKSVVDQKSDVSEIEIKVPKRKNLSISPCLEKMARKNDWSDVEMFDELPMDENESPESVSDRTKTPELEDDEDNIVDLNSLICDEKILNYMEEMQFRAAPNYLFDKPFPTENNFFIVGQKLEGIDPEHEALFCVMTVVQVCGFRIRLHFDGYPDLYDFWVNADCPDLFYPGWCEENSRMLQPPKNYGRKFDWTSYLEASHASAAPKKNFASTKILANCKTHIFRIGDKLEALDVLTRTLPKQIVCVGTVADIIGNRIRIHYDGWTDDYDCWMDVTSTNIHPVGWAKNNGRSLARPSGYNDYKGKKPFTWTNYLKETNSKPVPEEAFVPRPLRDFAVNTIIEVVDIAYPLLIRTAEILDVRGDELKILYDGFATKYAYWVEDDSPDIHPVGWSIKTNHPIEIPADENELAGCKIQGCTGKGNTNNLNAYNHLITKDCPYEFDSWENSVTGLTKLLDRLKNVEILINTSAISSTSETIQLGEGVQNGKNNLNASEHNNKTNHKGKIMDIKSNAHFSMKNIDYNNSLNKHDRESNNVNEKLRNDICLSFGTRSFGYSFMAKQSRIWTRHNVQLGIPMFNTSDARNWSSLEVATYVDQVVTNNYSIHNYEEYINISQRFLDQEIDGDVFLMLKQDEIMQLMKIPFGHAIKIYSAITMLRQRVPVFDWVHASNFHYNY